MHKHMKRSSAISHDERKLPLKREVVRGLLGLAGVPTGTRRCGNRGNEVAMGKMYTIVLKSVIEADTLTKRSGGIIPFLDTSC